MTTHNFLRSFGLSVIVTISLQTATADTTPVKRLFLESIVSGTTSMPKQEYSTFKYDDHGYITQYRHWDTDYSTEPQLSVFRDRDNDSKPVTDGRKIDIDDAINYLNDGYCMDIDYTYDSEGRCTKASWWHIKADGSRGVEIARAECNAENGHWMRRFYSWEEEDGNYFWCAPGVKGYNQWGDLEISGEYDHSTGHDSYDKFYEYEEYHFLRKLNPDEYVSNRLDIEDADRCDFVISYRDCGKYVRAYRIELSEDKLSAVIYRADYESYDHNDEPMPLADLDKYWEVYSRHSRSSVNGEWHTDYDAASRAAAPEYHEGSNERRYWEDLEGNYSDVRTDKFCWEVYEYTTCAYQPTYDNLGTPIGQTLVIIDGRKMRQHMGSTAEPPARPIAPQYQNPVGPFDDDYDELDIIRERGHEMYYWTDGGWYLQDCYATIGEYNNAGDFIYTDYTAKNGKRVARNTQTYSFDAQHRVCKFAYTSKWGNDIHNESTEYTYNSDGLLHTESTTITNSGNRLYHVTREYAYIPNPYYVPSNAGDAKQEWGTTLPFYISSITWKDNGYDLNGDGIITEDELGVDLTTVETYNYTEGTYVNPQMDYGFLSGIQVPTISTSRTYVFDLQGRRQSSLRKGLNIVRTTDGRTAKVLIK